MRVDAAQLWEEESRQDLTEKALLLVLLALAVIASMKTMAEALSNVFTSTAANLNSAT